MKQLSLSTLVCGVIIILAPIAQNVASLAMLTHLLAINPSGDFHLNGPLSDSYQGWCMFVGICLLVVGIVSGFKAGARDAAEPRTLGHPALSPSNG